MREYSCFIYFYENNKFTIINNTVCFVGLNYSKFFNKEIYIKNFKENEITDKERGKLIRLINKITPCKIVTIKKEEYIKFKMLHSYDSSLVLLNFIRNMWYNPGNKLFDYKLFFKSLNKRKYKDPLEIITFANKEATKEPENKLFLFSPGHSNVHRKDKLKIKKSEELLQYKGYSTKEFLINEP